MMLPKMPAVKLRAVWISLRRTKLTSRMAPRRRREKARVCLETLLGSRRGKKSLKMFSRMTMMQTEKAVTLRKRQKETMQQMKSSLPLKSSLQQMSLCDAPSSPTLLCTRSVPNAIIAVSGITSITVPATLNAILMNASISSRRFSVCVIVGMLWWNMNENTRFEKMSPKQLKLKKALPPSGVNVSTPPFWPMMMNAPRIMRKTETNLTVMVITCSGLVLEMLLKEKAAPEMKKTLSQNSKVPSSGTSLKTLERVLPVMMHLEMDTPKRQMAMATAGKNFQRSPYSTRNCSTWSTLSKSFSSSSGLSSFDSSDALWSVTTVSEFYPSSFSAFSRAIACIDSPTYIAEFRLSARITAVQKVDSRKPASKKGSGTMIGPAPRRRLMAMKAALYLGTSKMAVTLASMRLMGDNIDGRMAKVVMSSGQQFWWVRCVPQWRSSWCLARSLSFRILGTRDSLLSLRRWSAYRDWKLLSWLASPELFSFSLRCDRQRSKESSSHCSRSIRPTSHTTTRRTAAGTSTIISSAYSRTGSCSSLLSASCEGGGGREGRSRLLEWSRESESESESSSMSWAINWASGRVLSAGAKCLLREQLWPKSTVSSLLSVRSSGLEACDCCCCVNCLWRSSISISICWMSRSEFWYSSSLHFWASALASAATLAILTLN